MTTLLPNLVVLAGVFYSFKNTATALDCLLLNGTITSQQRDTILAQYWTPQIQSIAIEGCQPPIKNIENHAFTSLTDIRVSSLSIRNNSVERLGKETFDGLINITRLDLSLNAISYIEGGTFRHLPRLKHLFLQQNLLTTTSYATFYGLTQLQQLDLNNNRLRILGIDTFYQPRNLIDLRIAFNNIHYIPPSLFSTLAKLKSLEINHNKLSVVSNVDFHSLMQLRKLLLHNNDIGRIAENTFSYLNKLEQIHLNSNKIQEIRSSTFHGLSALKALFLQHNQIHSIAKDALREMTKLKRLDLSSNSLSDLSLSIGSLKSLQQLDISEQNTNTGVGGATVEPTNNDLNTTRSNPPTPRINPVQQTDVTASGSTIAVIIGATCAVLAAIVLMVTIYCVCKGLYSSSKLVVQTKHTKRPMEYLEHPMYLPKVSSNGSNGSLDNTNTFLVQRSKKVNHVTSNPDKVAVVSGVLRSNSNKSEDLEYGSSDMRVEQIDDNCTKQLHDTNAFYDNTAFEGDEKQDDSFSFPKEQDSQMSVKLSDNYQLGTLDFGSNNTLEKKMMTRLPGQEHMDVSLPPALFVSEDSIDVKLSEEDEDVSPYAIFKPNTGSDPSLETTSL